MKQIKTIAMIIFDVLAGMVIFVTGATLMYAYMHVSIKTCIPWAIIDVALVVALISINTIRNYISRKYINVLKINIQKMDKGLVELMSGHCINHQNLTFEEFIHKGGNRCPICLYNACCKTADEVEQELGKVLGYPWFKDDQKNFPGTTKADGVCVGNHVAGSIAAEAAHRISKLNDVVLSAIALKMNIEHGFPPNLSALNRDLAALNPLPEKKFNEENQDSDRIDS